MVTGPTLTEFRKHLGNAFGHMVWLMCVLHRAKSWTQWSWWFPSNSIPYSVILWSPTCFYCRESHQISCLLHFHNFNLNKIRCFGSTAWKTVSEFDYCYDYVHLLNFQMRSVPELLITVPFAADVDFGSSISHLMTIVLPYRTCLPS